MDAGNDVVVCNLKQAMQPSESTRWIGSGHDFEYPPVPFPSSAVFRAAGPGMFRSLVERHHELLLKSPMGQLFPSDPVALTRLVERVTAFVMEASGGPQEYSSQYGYQCVRTMHFPFTIKEADRESWLNSLWQAMKDVDFPQSAREPYWTWLEIMSIRMINRRTTKTPPVRWPYSQMVARSQ